MANLDPRGGRRLQRKTMIAVEAKAMEETTKTPLSSIRMKVKSI